MNSKRRPKGNGQKLRILANFDGTISDIPNAKPARKASLRYLPTANSRAGSQRER